MSLPRLSPGNLNDFVKECFWRNQCSVVRPVIMASRAHNWMNRGCWVVEVKSWMVASYAHLERVDMDSGFQ